MSNTGCFINNPFIHCHPAVRTNHRLLCSTLTLSLVSIYNDSGLEVQKVQFYLLPDTCVAHIPHLPVSPFLSGSHHPLLGLKMVNLQGWRTGQVGWPSAVWPWAERGQSEAAGPSPGPWRGAQRMCPSQLREACRGRWWCRRMSRTRLEEGWRAALEEQPGVEEHGRMSRRTGGRKQTCYDFDDGATQAVGQGGVMEEGGTDMKNKHKEIKNTKHIKQQWNYERAHIRKLREQDKNMQQKSIMMMKMLQNQKRLSVFHLKKYFHN